MSALIIDIETIRRRRRMNAKTGSNVIRPQFGAPKMKPSDDKAFEAALFLALLDR
jgi:hypothetical protein